MTKDEFRDKLAKAIHEARIALAWGPSQVGSHEPWPNFDDPLVLRAYPHNPIAYVDLARASADAAIEVVADAAIEVVKARGKL